MLEYVISGAVIYALFFLMCYINTGSDKKNMKSYYSYPDEIQNLIRKDKELSRLIPKESNYITSFVSNFVMFLVVFMAAGFIVNSHKFSETFLYFLLMGEGLNLFDFLVIDCYWFTRTKRTRFENIGNPKMYVGYKKHFISFVKAIPVFFSAALVGAIILAAFR